MPDILIRDLPDEVIASIDAQAQRLGLSRSEYLRRELLTKAHINSPTRRKITIEDLRRAAELLSDLNDPDVMAGAWS